MKTLSRRGFKIPIWSDIHPEYQLCIVGVAFFTLLFRNFLGDLWYHTLIAIWMSMLVVFVLFLLYHVFNYKTEKSDAK